MTLSAGKLNRWITVQKSAGLDELNQPLDNWIKYCGAWSWHKALTGRASVKNGVVTSINGNSWRIRYTEKHLGITTDMRVLYGGTTFKITRIAPDFEGKEHIDLICEENASHA